MRVSIENQTISLAKSRSHGPEDRVTGRPRQRANVLSGRANFKLLTCDTVLRAITRRKSFDFGRWETIRIYGVRLALLVLHRTPRFYWNFRGLASIL